MRRSAYTGYAYSRSAAQCIWSAESAAESSNGLPTGLRAAASSRRCSLTNPHGPILRRHRLCRTSRYGSRWRPRGQARWRPYPSPTVGRIGHPSSRCMSDAPWPRLWEVLDHHKKRWTPQHALNRLFGEHYPGTKLPQLSPENATVREERWSTKRLDATVRPDRETKGPNRLDLPVAVSYTHLRAH